MEFEFHTGNAWYRSTSFTTAFCRFPIEVCGPGSLVGIATGYGLDGPGIESRWGRDFPHLSGPALGPTQPPVKWVPGLSRGKERPGRDADPPPLLVPWSRKSRAIPLLPLWAVRPVQSLSACTRVHFTFYFYPYKFSQALRAWCETIIQVDGIRIVLQNPYP